MEIIASETPEYDAEELAQMPMRQLRALMLQMGIEVDGCLEKADLLERVINSRLITVTHGASPAYSGGDGGGYGDSISGGGNGGSSSSGGAEWQAPWGTRAEGVQGQSVPEERRDSPSTRVGGGGGGGGVGGAGGTGGGGGEGGGGEGGGGEGGGGEGGGGDGGGGGGGARRSGWWWGSGGRGRSGNSGEAGGRGEDSTASQSSSQPSSQSSPPPPPPPPTGSGATGQGRTQPAQTLERMSVKDLRAIMNRLGVSTVGCLEKGDMVERIRDCGRYQDSGGGR